MIYIINNNKKIFLYLGPFQKEQRIKQLYKLNYQLI